MHKPTIIFDFDGVIHSYTSGWKGADIIPDPPVPGIKEAIDEIRKAGYQVVVLSARCHQGGIKAIEKWLKKYNIKVDNIVRDKVPALLQVDDRCICFDGRSENLLQSIKEFIPWNKKSAIE
jgi:histidinol phosphatase-like enzyme